MDNKILLPIFFIITIIYSQEKTAYTIDEALDTALNNNSTIKKVEFDIKIAEEKVWETKAVGLPQINANFNYNYFLNEQEQVFPASFNDPLAVGLIAFSTGIKQNMSASATLSQLIFSGSYLVGLQSVKVYKMISELAKEKTEIAVKEAVYYSYSGIVIANENINILKENIKISEKNLHDVSEIYKVGLGEEQAVDQIQYNHSTLLLALSNTEETRKSLLISLKYLLGISLDEKINLSTSLEELIAKSTILTEEVNEESMKNNVDIKIAENEVKSKKLQIKFEKSKALPTISSFLTDIYSAYSDKFEFNGGKLWNNAVIVGLSVDIPIFSSFLRKSKVEQAKINFEKAEISRVDVLTNLVKEGKNKKIEYENALSKYNNTKDLIQLSNKIYNKEQIKFYEGIGTSSELSNAEKQKYDAQNQYINAAFQLIQAKISLDKVLSKL